jgi:RNA polymerase sigma-70 factor (ECF subfamily)
MSTQAKSWLWSALPANAADFEELYQEQLPRIYNFFRYRFGDNALAEDLTAATFEKAWQNRHQYRRNLSALTTWLFTIARRIAIDHYRRPQAEVTLDEAIDLGTNENVEDQVQNLADIRHLSALLPQLDDREQELVALKYGAGLTNRTIASLTGLTESNVGVILHRAILFLRKEWDGSNE